jgi:1-deoxy-D-xylulose-5-phosphate synthase
MGKYLDTINDPVDVRRLKIKELDVLADELRQEVISVVSEVGGHFASTLGAIELTLALHYLWRRPCGDLRLCSPRHGGGKDL